MSDMILRNIIIDIVQSSCELKNKYTDEFDAPVNYACIFCQSEEEFNKFKKQTSEIGRIIEETSTGPLYRIEAIETVSGQLKLLKIRRPDKTRPERGDADFTVKNFESFKNRYLSGSNFTLIQRENFEMVELTDPKFNVRTYFSYPPLDKLIA